MSFWNDRRRIGTFRWVCTAAACFVALVFMAAPAAAVDGTIIAASDFENGNYAPFSTPPEWVPRISVIPDPTGAAHGQVLQIHYTNGTGTVVDDNKALFIPRPGFSLKLGEEIWFRGDFYFPGSVDLTLDMQRKLLYFSTLDFPENVATVLTSFGSMYMITTVVQGPSNIPEQYNYLSGHPITTGVWHHLEFQMRLESGYGTRDGLRRLWVDGTLIHERLNMQFTDPLWAEDPSTYQWTSFGFGYQVNSLLRYDEVRYWDNVSFSRVRLPPAVPNPVSTGGGPSINVFPNPWRSDRHSGMPITFSEMGPDTEITIFTAAGRLVKALPASTGSVGWDLTNESGKKVGSGIYLYVAKDRAGNRVRGKLAVIK